jgi:hypothetical protein
MQKLKIKINHQLVDLPPNLNHELVWRNPLLSYDYVLGGYSTPFSLPFTNTNNRIFANANAFDAANVPQVYYCEKYFNDNLIEEGYTRLKDTNGSYNLYFTSNLGEIWAGNKDADLYDLLPDITLTTREVAGTPNVIFPTIQNAGFYQANGGAYAGIVNAHNGTTYTGPTYVPAFQVKYILSQLATLCGFTLAGTFWANTAMDKLYLFQNTEINSLTIAIRDALTGITPSTFIANLRKALGLMVSVNIIQKTLTIDFSQDYFQAEVTADWSPYCSAPQSGRQASGIVGIKLGYNLNTDDKLTTTEPSHQPYTTPSTETDAKYYEIISNYSPLAMAGGLPIMDEQGRTSINKQDTKRLTPRLGFYKGLISTSFGNRPVLDITEGQYTLSNDAKATSKFLAEETFWKNTFETSFQLRINSKINLAQISDKVYIHGQNYFVKEIVLNTANPTIATLKAMRA